MNSKRFGGAHSPGAAKPAGGPAPAPARRSGPGIGARLLYLWPVPLLGAAILDLGAGSATGAAVDLLAFACLMAAAWLTGEGLRARAEFEARDLAAAPLPRLVPAAGLTAVGVVLAAGFAWGLGLVQGLGMGLLAGAAYAMAFGLDPLKSKGDAGQLAEARRVSGTLDAAEARIANLRRMATKFDDAEIRERLVAVADRIGGMVAQVRADPRDLSRARRYLTVYLEGAEAATSRYLDSPDRGRDPALRTAYAELLGELDGRFARGADHLLTDDRMELEVEIDVLRERLAQES